MGIDLLIKNGTVVDGTRRPRYRADVAVVGDKVVEIGKIKDSAKRVIDASDLVVAPGFIDLHTHYDAQICWDPLITCSSWHGVTTVITGNCGVGVAPCRPGARDIATWDLVNVEAIPFEVLEKGLTWDWETFPQYMSAAERRGSAINLAFRAPLTPFRHYVMGEESFERAASIEETASIRQLLKEAISAGAIGWSLSKSGHIGYKGRPLASRLASMDELKAYASVLKELNRGVIEVAAGSGGALGSDNFKLVETLVRESNGHVTGTPILKRFTDPTLHLQAYEEMKPLIKLGHRPQIAPQRFVSELDLREPFILQSIKMFGPVFNKSAEEVKKIYSDPAFRETFHKELSRPQGFHSSDMTTVWVVETGRPDMKHLIGKSVADIAKERGKDDADTFFDLVLEDDLNLVYTMARSEVPNDLLNNPDMIFGLSDAGAHVGILCDAGYTTETLGRLVREQQLMDLETAIWRMTGDQADFLGIRDRGRLQPGFAADFAIFDPATVYSACERAEARFDLPGGGKRMVVQSQGMEYTIVNGQVLYEHQKLVTDALPGRVVKSEPFTQAQ